MDREAGVGSLHANCTSTSQLASYATGLSTDSPRTFGIAVYYYYYYYTGQAAQLIMPRGLDLSQTITITVNYILK